MTCAPMPCFLPHAAGVGELVKAARGSPTLRVLDVSMNWLGPRAMAACLQQQVGGRVGGWHLPRAKQQSLPIV